MSEQKQQAKKLRAERLASLIQELLGPILSDALESLPSGLVNVSRVEISGDLKWAKVWLSVIGTDDDTVLKLLKKNIYNIQGELNRQVKMKIVPRIQFFIDTSARFAAHINDVINHLHDND